MPPPLIVSLSIVLLQVFCTCCFSHSKPFLKFITLRNGGKTSRNPSCVSTQSYTEFAPFHPHLSCEASTASRPHSLAPSWAFGLLCTLSLYHLPPIILFAPHRPDPSFSSLAFASTVLHRFAPSPPIKAEIPSSVTSVSLKRVR